jgi:hypothetical protein
VDFKIEFWGIMVFVAMTVTGPAGIDTPGKRIVMPTATDHVAFIAFPDGAATVPNGWTKHPFAPHAGWFYYVLPQLHLALGGTAPFNVTKSYEAALPKVSDMCSPFGRMPAKWTDRKKSDPEKAASVDIAAGDLRAGVGPDTDSMISRLRMKEATGTLTIGLTELAGGKAAGTIEFKKPSEIIIGNELSTYLDTGVYDDPNGGDHFKNYRKFAEDPKTCNPDNAPLPLVSTNRHHIAMKTGPSEGPGGTAGDCSNTGYP